VVSRVPGRSESPRCPSLCALGKSVSTPWSRLWDARVYTIELSLRQESCDSQSLESSTRLCREVHPRTCPIALPPSHRTSRGQPSQPLPSSPGRPCNTLVYTARSLRRCNGPTCHHEAGVAMVCRGLPGAATPLLSYPRRDNTHLCRPFHGSPGPSHALGSSHGSVAPVGNVHPTRACARDIAG
jgi:hypothetical protein